MVAAFLRAGGMQSGAAKLDDAELETAGALLRKHGEKIGIPTDVTVASEFNADAIASVKTADNVAGEDLILDIGPDTAAAYAEEIGRAKTILWNGPMGVAEWEQFSHGTTTVANAVSSNSSAVTVVGGGSTAEVVSRLGLERRITHVSTGGGASLEFLEGRVLPGVAALGG
jgi:phosphoglycerate kinase